MHKVVILPRAEQDLDDIVEYLGGFYPGTAVRQYDQIAAAILSLEEFPNKFEAYKPGQFQFDHRKMVVGDYLVFYVVNDTEVVIHRILHGKRDISRYMEQ